MRMRKKRQLGYVESVQCRPSYHFSIKNTQLSEFSRLYFDVDAITGEITTMGFKLGKQDEDNLADDKT